MKWSGSLVTASLVATLAAGVASAQTPPDPYATLLNLEAIRSLGSGELAAICDFA